jgi:carbamoyl-phosphate synthase/aspartate carbamoyltransferase/dihydroorotase
MRPPLAEQTDVDTLWTHLHTTIDCIATDHAPHTLAEKESTRPPPGVTGLETALPVMLTAVQQKRLTLERLIELMSTNPRRIYKLPAQSNTSVEVDPQARYTIANGDLHTKCGWSPFAGFTVTGRLQRVVLRGQTVFELDKPGVPGKILAQPGYGRLIPS